MVGIRDVRTTVSIRNISLEVGNILKAIPLAQVLARWLSIHLE
jgi:hypothetical protein